MIVPSNLMKAAKKIVVTSREDQLVTQEAVEWLGLHNNMEYPDWVVDRIADEMRSDANSVRTGRFGASSRGDCLRAQVFSYIGFPSAPRFDYQLHNIFHDGHWRHMRWQAMLLTMGRLTDIEKRYSKGHFGISMDGVNEEEGWLFELKGAHTIPREIPEKHLMQIHTYFEVSGMDTCCYLVEDKRTQDWREWVVTPMDNYTQAVREEMDSLDKAIETETLPEILPACHGGGGPSKRCPYAKDCLTYEDPWWEYPV